MEDKQRRGFWSVGESGCGKSTTAHSILRLIQKPGRIVGGEIWFEGENLLAKNEADMRKIRGARISMVFQNPMSSLNAEFIEVRKGHFVACHLEK